MNTDEFGGVAVEEPPAFDSDTRARMVSAGMADEFGGVPVKTDQFGGVEEPATVDMSQVKPTKADEFTTEAIRTGGTRSPEKIGEGNFTAAIGANPKDFIENLPSIVMGAAAIPGKLAYYQAADAVSKLFNDPEYGGNLAALQRGDEQLPVETFIAKTAKTNPNLAVTAKLGQSAAELSPTLGLAAAPAAVNRVLAAGFSASMIASAPKLFDAYATEINKPEDEQDAGKLADLKSQMIQTFLFAPLAGAGAMGKTARGDARPTSEGKIPVEWREIQRAPADEFGGVPVEPVAEVQSPESKPVQSPKSKVQSEAPPGVTAVTPPIEPEKPLPATIQEETTAPARGPADGVDARPTVARDIMPTDRAEEGVPIQTFERPPDILDDIDAHVGGVKIADAPDFDYVREAFQDLSQSKAGDLSGAKLKQLFRGSDPDLALDALHREGLWRNVQTPDELYQRMIGAAKARVEWAKQEKQAAKYKSTVQSPQSEAEDPWAVGDVGPMDYVGMGGASPKEFEHAPGESTALKNARVDQERVKRGLPPAMEPARRSFGEVWDQVNTMLDNDPKRADRLVEELRVKPRALTDTEDALLLQQQISLQNEYGRLTRELAQAHDDAKEFPNRLDDTADLKLRVAKLSDDLLDLYNINKSAGTETGRGLAARRMMAYEDFSLAKMEMDKRAVNDGRPLTEAEHAEVQQLHERIATTQKAYDDYVAKTEAERAQRQASEEINDMIDRAEKMPGYDRQVNSLADRIVGALEREAVKAKTRLREKLMRASAGVDPTILGDLAVMGAAKIARGTLDFTRWSREMVDDLGEEVVPWLNQAWKRSNERLDEAVMRVAQGKKSIAVKQVLRKEDVTGQRENIIEGLREQKGQPLNELGSYVRKLAENFVRSGIKDRDALVNAVHDVLTKEVDPALTRRQAMDAISGYGDFKPLDADKIKVEMRDLRGQMQQVAKLEDIQAKAPLRKTGVERRLPTDEERRLIQQVNEAKRRYGVVTTDAASQLKSALDAIKTRLRNSIKDLDFQISTKEKIVRTRTPVPFDAEATRLKMERAELKAKFDEVFAKPGLTDDQRVQNALRSVKDSIAEYERRIAAKDISRPGSKTPETPELAATRTRRDALKAEFDDLRDANEDYQREQAGKELERQRRSLEDSIKLKQEQLRTGTTEPAGRPVNRPADPALEQLMQQRDALNRQLDEVRNPVRTPEERALAALKTRLKQRTVELQDKLDREDFTTRPRRTVTPDAEALRLKAEMEKAKQAFQRALLTDRLKNRPWYIKGQDTFLRWRRGFLLSSPVTLAKLTSAALQRLVVTPIEEAVGGVISKIVPGLADRAPREGGLNVNAEAKAMTEGFMKGLKDSWDQLRHGESQMDVLYGKGREGAIGESDVLPKSIIDFFGHLHSALKAPVKRAEFARSFEKRMAWNLRKGVDVRDPAVQTRISVEAYKDANRSIFLQDNRVVSAYKAGLALIEKRNQQGNATLGGKVAGTALRAALPIVRVPTNLVAETFQYVLGSVSGSTRLALAMRKGIETLQPDEAEMIMRHLKKGSLGAAFLLAGYFMPTAIGGYYQPGQKRDKADVPVGGLRIGGVNIPSYLLHNPLLETLQVGATIRRVADSKLRKRDEAPQGIPAGLWAGGLGLAEDVPFVREMLEVSKAFEPASRGAFTGELAKSIAIPQAVQWIARQTDKDASGEVVARKPQTTWQHIETGIPRLRRNVPPAPLPAQPAVSRFMQKIKGGTPQMRESMRQVLLQQMATNAPAAHSPK